MIEFRTGQKTFGNKNLGNVFAYSITAAMSESGKSSETRKIMERFPLLKRREREAWDECMSSLMRIAERGIITAVRDAGKVRNEEIELTVDQKQELQDKAVHDLYKSFDALENGEHMAGRLWLIAKNRTTDWIRSYAFNKTQSIEALEEQAKNHGPELSIKELTSFDMPDEIFFKSERSSLVDHALNLVGEPCHTLIVELCLNDKTYAQMACLCGITEDGVYKRFQKCKQLFKTHFCKLYANELTIEEVLA